MKSVDGVMSYSSDVSAVHRPAGVYVLALSVYLVPVAPAPAVDTYILLFAAVTIMAVPGSLMRDTGLMDWQRQYTFSTLCSDWMSPKFTTLDQSS
jgi:hypothetical protein